MRREDWLLGIKFLLSVIFIQRDELRVCQRKKSLMVVEWLLFSEKYKQLSGDLRALVPAIVMPVFYCPITISPRILSLRTKTNICNLSRAWWGSSTWGLCSTHCQLGGWTEGSGMAHSRGAGGGGTHWHWAFSQGCGLRTSIPFHEGCPSPWASLELRLGSGSTNPRRQEVEVPHHWSPAPQTQGPWGSEQEEVGLKKLRLNPSSPDSKPVSPPAHWSVKHSNTQTQARL